MSNTKPTAQVRMIELQEMDQAALVALYLTYTKPSAKRLAAIKNAGVTQLIDWIINYEWGANLVDL